MGRAVNLKTPFPPLKGVAIICVPLERDSNVFHQAAKQRNKQNK